MERDDGGRQTGRRQRAQGRGQERSQLKTRLGGVTAWTKRSKTCGEFMALKKPAAKKKAANKFKGVRQER
jgi:hypothetical protein